MFVLSAYGKEKHPKLIYYMNWIDIWILGLAAITTVKY